LPGANPAQRKNRRAMIVHLTDIMPAHFRASGFSLAYSLAAELFGGFTLMIATYSSS
jgi:MFS transporter, MHS family, citrate/tricarballylate:H+ symporter